MFCCCRCTLQNYTIFSEIEKTPWTDCSATCDNGTKTRQVFCTKGGIEVTDPNDCNGFQSETLVFPCLVEYCPVIGRIFIKSYFQKKYVSIELELFICNGKKSLKLIN